MKRSTKLYTVAALTTGLTFTATPAQAGTPAYWKTATCSGYPTSTVVGVGWQKSGTSRRPTQVDYTSLGTQTGQMYVAYYKNGVFQTSHTFQEGGLYSDKHNWDGLVWGTDVRVYIKLTSTSGYVCSANVYK